MASDTATVETGNGHDTSAKNGKVRLLSIGDLDGRTRAAQRCRESRADVLADLGGADNLSTLERQAADKVALLDAMITDQGVRWLRGESIDPTALATLINTFNRTAAALGWQRRSKDVTPPHPLDYAAQRDGRAPE